MGTTIFLLLVLIVIAVLAAVMKRKKSQAEPEPKDVKRGSFVKKSLLSENEQPMFWRIKETFPEPEFIVLAQVSFGALLQAKDGASRYSFAQKFADFVLTDKAFTVKAVIELDDKSHRGKEEQDAKRDQMLIDAGYKVLRYTKTPDSTKLRGDVNTPTINITTPG